MSLQIPLLALAEAAFSTLRKPFDRAIEGEFEGPCDRICKKSQVVVQRAAVERAQQPAMEQVQVQNMRRAKKTTSGRTYRSATTLAQQTPERVSRKTGGRIVTS